MAVWTVKCMSTDSSLYIFRQPFTECLSCLTLHVLLLLLFYNCWCYYTSPPYHLAQVRQRADIYIYIYIYINTLCQEQRGGRVVNILQKEKKVREGGGQRAESDGTKMNICDLSVSLVRLYQKTVTKFQILSFERFPWIFLPPL